MFLLSVRKVKTGMVEQEEVVLYVVRQLAAFRDRKEIAKVVAERGLIDYNEAEKFVRQVEKKHRRKIALARLPITLVAGGLTAVVGLYMSVSGFLNISAGYYTTRTIVMLIIGVLMLLGGTLGTLAAVYPVIEK
jgi:uncharacterized membrane protein